MSKSGTTFKAQKRLNCRLCGKPTLNRVWGHHWDLEMRAVFHQLLAYPQCTSCMNLLSSAAKSTSEPNRECYSCKGTGKINKYMCCTCNGTGKR